MSIEALMKKHIAEFINKKLLIEEQDWLNPIEVKVLELSPAKEYIKLQKLDNSVYWRKVSAIKIIELLN